jgi:hypothetical protein
MASISIPWKDGPGNIVLTYTGQGNGTVTVTSDTDNKGYDRQQTISFYVTDGAIRHTLVSSNDNRLKTADGHYLRSLDNAMKVTVTVIQPTGMRVIVTADNHQLRTANGNILRCVSAS